MEKEVSCRISNALIQYLESQGYDTTKLCENLPYSKEFLNDPLNWISVQTRDTLADRAAILTGDNKIMYRAGLSVPDCVGSIYGFEHLISLLGSPKIAYKNISRLSHFFDLQFVFNIEFINNRTALIRMTQQDNQRPSLHAFNFAQGMLEAIPQLWQLPPAEVTVHEHTCSISESNKNKEKFNCLYEIKWQASKGWLSTMKTRILGINTNISDHIEAIENYFQLLDEKNRELLARNEQLNKVREIALKIDSLNTLSETFRMITELSREIPGISLVLVLRPDDTKQYFTVPYCSSIYNRDFITAIKANEIDIGNITGIKSIKGDLKIPISQVKISRDYFNNPNKLVFEHLSDMMEEFWTHQTCDSIQKILRINKFVSIPLMIENRFWGCLLFLLNDEISIDILEMITAHCSVALKNVLALEKLERRNQELAAINAIAAKTAKSFEIDNTINELNLEIIRIFSAEGVAIYLNDETTDFLRLVAQNGMPETLLKRFQVPLIRYLENFLHSTENIASSNLNQLNTEDPELSALEMTENTLWLMSTALIFEGRRSGTVTIIRRNNLDFNEEEKSLLNSISNQLSMAFENNRLHKHLIQKLNDLETTQNKLSEAEEKMDLTIDSLSEGIMVTSLDGRILQANDAAAKIHGYYRTDNFVGKHALQYVDDKDRRRMLDNLKKIKNTGEFITAEYTLVKKNLSRFETECNISTYNNFLGEPSGFVICIRDVSQRKQSEKRLQDSERKYRLIAENTNDYIATITLGGYFIYTSPSYRQLGYEPQELTGSFSINLIHQEDQQKWIAILLKFAQMDSNDIKRLRKDNYSQSLEYRLKDKSGTWHDLETTINFIESLDGSNYNILLISRDVTIRKQTENQLLKLYNREKEVRNTLELEIGRRANFFRALVHELKTPLTPILISSEMIKETAPDRTNKNLAQNIYDGAIKLNNRVDELLDISKAEIGILKIHQDAINMVPLIKEISDCIMPHIIQNHQNLVMNIPEFLPLVNGDESRLRQIILNLLDNSMKFTPEGGQITLQAISDNKYILIKVQDTGSGIDESEKERIFQPYNRIETDRQNFSGLGLGLALCKQLVDLHGGKLWIESQKGKGSSFFFSLPIIQSSQSEYNSPIEQSEHQ